MTKTALVRFPIIPKSAVVSRIRKSLQKIILLYYRSWLGRAVMSQCAVRRSYRLRGPPTGRNNDDNGTADECTTIIVAFYPFRFLRPIRRQWKSIAVGRRTVDATCFMRPATRQPLATAATTQTLRHRRRRRRRRIFFFDPKTLAAHARHVRVAVQGNPGEFVQVRSPTTAARRNVFFLRASSSFKSVVEGTPNSVHRGT